MLFMILSLILICLGFCASSFSNYTCTQKLDNSITSKSPLNTASRYSYTYMGLGDLLSESTLNSILSWASDNPYYNGFVTMDGTMRYYNLLQDYPTQNASDNIDNIFYISALNNSPNSQPSTIFNARRLGFQSSIVNASSYRLWQYYIEFGNDGNNEVWWLCYFRFTDIVNSVPLSNGQASTLFNAKFVHKPNGNGSDVLIDTKDYAMFFYPHSTSYDIFTRNVISDNSLSYTQGYDNGRLNGYNSGYQDGYTAGVEDQTYNPEMLTIFTGILDIGLLPVNVFLTIMNFEVFGINIAGFVSSLLTIAIVIIIIRFLFGGKNND